MAIGPEEGLIVVGVFIGVVLLGIAWFVVKAIKSVLKRE